MISPWAGRRPTPAQLAKILALHRQWRVTDARDGERADLSGAYLRGADLRDAYLRGADLSDADLRGADLSDADLRGAVLSGAYLRDANLRGADLSGAVLSGAYLRDANLSGADLRGAVLRDAYLRGADLSDADLSGADLGRTLQRIGPLDGLTMVAVQWSDGPRIACGCRWFTTAEAREHWGPGCVDRRAHGDIMLAGLDALLSICRAHGWTGCEVAR